MVNFKKYLAVFIYTAIISLLISCSSENKTRIDASHFSIFWDKSSIGSWRYSIKPVGKTIEIKLPVFNEMVHSCNLDEAMIYEIDHTHDIGIEYYVLDTGGFDQSVKGRDLTNAKGIFSYITRHSVSGKIWYNEGVDVSICPDKHAKISVEFNGASAAIIFFGVEEG